MIIKNNTQSQTSSKTKKKLGLIEEILRESIISAKNSKKSFKSGKALIRDALKN